MNYLIYTNGWNLNNSFAKIWSQGSGPINTVGYVKQIKINHIGLVCNSDGTISGLIHQYDRHESLKKTFLNFEILREHQINDIN